MQTALVGGIFMQKNNKSNSKLNVRKLVFSALLVAVHAVLAAFISIDAIGMKFTFEGLPIILGGLMYGPLDGMGIGLLGSFVAQLWRYGFGVTTLLWIIPHGARGLLVGWYAKRHNYSLNDKQLVFITLMSALLTTTLNTPVMYIDALVFHYDTTALVPLMLLMRYISSAIVALLFAAVIRPLRARLAPFIDNAKSERG